MEPSVCAKTCFWTWKPFSKPSIYEEQGKHHQTKNIEVTNMEILQDIVHTYFCATSSKEKFGTITRIPNIWVRLPYQKIAHLVSLQSRNNLQTSGLAIFFKRLETKLWHQKLREKIEHSLQVLYMGPKGWKNTATLRRYDELSKQPLKRHHIKWAAISNTIASLSDLPTYYHLN